MLKTMIQLIIILVTDVQTIRYLYTATYNMC